MKNAVIDTSVMVKWINSVDEKYLVKVDKLKHDVKRGALKLWAPELARYEIGNVLINKKLGFLLSQESLTTIYASPVKFVVLDEKQALKTLEIALECKITFYDAAFLSLAEKLKAVVVTDNFKDMGKYNKVKVIDLKDY